MTSSGAAVGPARDVPAAPPGSATVAVFHVDAHADVAASLAKETPTFRSPTDYRVLLDLLLASLDRSMPGSRVVLLTDPTTGTESLSTRILVDRAATVGEGLMLARMRAQREYLGRAPAGPVFFLDADMLVLEDLRAALDGCDLAVTVRNDPEMPINGGFIAVAEDGRARAAAFLDAALRIYLEEYGSQGAWWGDQRALARLVGVERCRTQIGQVVDAGGARVRLLPCDRYNRSPDRSIAYLRRGRAVAIMHFKGARKRFMAPYWRAFHGAGPWRSPAALRHRATAWSRMARMALWEHLGRT